MEENGQKLASENNENEIIKADTEGVSKEYIEELDDTKGKSVITIIDHVKRK